MPKTGLKYLVNLVNVVRDELGDEIEMLRRFRKAIMNYERADGNPYDTVEVKPHGRVAYTMQAGGGGYIDISIIGHEFMEKHSKEKILYNKKYRKLSIKELADIILYKISPQDYDAIQGITSIGKAKNLHKLWKITE